MPEPSIHVLVEGADDHHSIRHLVLKRLPQIDIDGVKFEECGGFAAVKQRISEVLFNDPTLERIGIVVDADDHPNHRWRSLRDRLRDFGVEMPEHPPEGGWLGKADKKLVGCWMMPDNVRSGCLETLLTAMVRPDDPLWSLACGCAAEAKEKGAEFTSFDKANLHTWLAWRRDPGRPCGLSIKNESLDPNAEAADRLVAWCENMLGSATGS